MCLWFLCYVCWHLLEVTAKTVLSLWAAMELESGCKHIAKLCAEGQVFPFLVLVKFLQQLKTESLQCYIDPERWRYTFSCMPTPNKVSKRFIGREWLLVLPYASVPFCWWALLVFKLEVDNTMFTQPSMTCILTHFYNSKNRCKS